MHVLMCSNSWNVRFIKKSMGVNQSSIPSDLLTAESKIIPVAEFAGFVQRIFLHGWFNTHFSFYKVYFTQILYVNYNNPVFYFTTSNHSH
jgi:hypothetical protein